MLRSSVKVVPPKAAKETNAVTDALSVIISSDDISLLPSDASDPLSPSFKTTFEYLDPPPTQMKVSLPTWPTQSYMSGTSSKTRVYLRRYAFDAIWRDSNDPSSTITSNSGTSLSKKLMLTFFVGANGTQRLIKPNTAPTSTSYADVIIPRNTTLIGELSSYPYATTQSTNNDLYFEQQYCQQVEYIGQPGLYIGELDPQAVAALRANTTITVQISTDRSDYPSPFWYSKFLKGVSLWNPLTHQYDIVPSGEELIKYYKKVSSVVVTELGGPFFPTCLYRFAKPYLYDIHAQVVTTSTIQFVNDPLRGEYIASASPKVSCWVSQVGLTSNDLSTLRYASIRNYLVANSDEHSFTIPVWVTDTSTVSTVTIYDDQGNENVPVRFSPNPEFLFPNGVWRGTPLTAKATASGSNSCFPFETHLTADIANIVDDNLHYAIASPDVKIEIVPNHLFLHMDVGSQWLEDMFTVNDIQYHYTASERSLQFDMGRSVYVNKLQLIFPRSQEDYQPVRMGASLHQKYGANVADVHEAPLPIWFGGYQHDSPSGSQTSSDASLGYTFLNTHTQTDNTLYTGGTNLMNVTELYGPSDKPFSGTTTRPVYAQDLGGRTQIVKPGSDTYVSVPPNTVNPAFDSYRQEFGPFVRGCTAEELYDTSFVKAIVPRGQNAVWSQQCSQGDYFTKPEDFLLTSTAQILMQAAIFVIVSGLVQRLQNTSADKAILMDVSVRKYLYSVDYYDVVIPLPALSFGSFTSVTDFLLGSPETTDSSDKGKNQFSVYLVSGDTSTSVPLQEYIVKETYYFAPSYNQYYTSQTGGDVFRPDINSAAQKMVRQEYSQGRYLGLTFGSFLSGPDASTPRFTRGKIGNKLRLYSVRLCTQLFTFQTSGGTVVDTSATLPANFTKNYDAGILKSCNVDRNNLGRKYLQDTYVTPDVKAYATLPGKADTVFIDVATGVAADRTETLVDGNLEALNNAAGTTPFEQTQPAVIQANMQDDTSLNEYAFYLKAAIKTPLRRFAEIQLDLVSD